jgi:hypothetical protein
VKWLKFGDMTLNIERAIRIDDNGRVISVEFAAVDSHHQAASVRLEGRAAEALRRWLAANAEDLFGPDERSTGDALDDPRPYVSPR